MFVLSSVCLSNFCYSTPKTDVKCSPLYVYVTLSKNMLQNPLINTRGRFGAGAGAARGHPFLVGAGAGAGAYLRFPRPLTPDFFILSPFLFFFFPSHLPSFTPSFIHSHWIKTSFRNRRRNKMDISVANFTNLPTRASNTGMGNSVFQVGHLFVVIVFSLWEICI